MISAAQMNHPDFYPQLFVIKREKRRTSFTVHEAFSLKTYRVHVDVQLQIFCNTKTTEGDVCFKRSQNQRTQQHECQGPTELQMLAYPANSRVIYSGLIT